MSAVQVNYPDTTFQLIGGAGSTELSSTYFEQINTSIASSQLENGILTITEFNDPGYSSTFSYEAMTVKNTATDKKLLADPTQLAFTSANGATENAKFAVAGMNSNSATFDMSFNALSFQGVAGTLNQVLTTDASGVAHWEDAQMSATPNLADVLAVATAGDANNQPISNLSQLGFQPASGDTLVLSGVAGAGGVLNLSTTADDTKATKQFTGNYLPIAVDGTIQYLQLFDVA
jgi:hypothetical protein